MNKVEPKIAWYRQPLVLMVIAIPLSAVFSGMTMLYLSITTYDGLVNDDYYQYGKQINLVLERDNEAKRIGLTGAFDFKPDTGIVLVQLTSKLDELPHVIDLEMLHATRGGHDQKIELVLTPGKGYHGLINDLIPGRWYVRLSTPAWRITDELRYPGQTTVKFTADY